MGALGFRLLTEREVIAAVLPTFFAWHLARWEAQGQRTTFIVEEHRRILTDAVLDLAPPGCGTML